MKKMTAFVTIVLAALLCVGMISAGAVNVGSATSVVRYGGTPNTAKVTVRFGNGTSSAISGTVTAAVYDANGRFRFITQGALNAAAGETASLQLMTEQTINKTDLVRIFWWDNALNPLCDATDSIVHDYLEVLTVEEESSLLYAELQQ